MLVLHDLSSFWGKLLVRKCVLVVTCHGFCSGITGLYYQLWLHACPCLHCSSFFTPDVQYYLLMLGSHFSYFFPHVVSLHGSWLCGVPSFPRTWCSVSFAAYLLRCSRWRPWLWDNLKAHRSILCCGRFVLQVFYPAWPLFRSWFKQEWGCDFWCLMLIKPKSQTQGLGSWSLSSFHVHV